MNTILRYFMAMCLAALFLLAACGGDAAPENVYVADEADNGQTVNMAVGDVLQIMLSENPTTGYVWSIVTNDESVLRLSDEPAYEAESDLIGAGGTRTFLFDAVGPGTSQLSLVNARQQETAVEPAATFELTVQVVD
jgi:inhibitor of cysteine peptidase